MTSKERVLAIHPDARCCWIAPSDNRRYGVFIGAYAYDKQIGEGIAEESAWQNAAESLPVQPEQDEDVDFCHEPDCPCYDEQHSRDCKNCECQCNRPPEGWRCTRRYGHTGPCAAIAGPKPTPSAPDRVQAALRRIMNRVEVISKAGEFDVRDSQFIENELLDVWNHHSLKPHPDSSSIPDEKVWRHLVKRMYDECGSTKTDDFISRVRAGEHDVPSPWIRDSSSIDLKLWLDQAVDLLNLYHSGGCPKDVAKDFLEKCKLNFGNVTEYTPFVDSSSISTELSKTAYTHYAKHFLGQDATTHDLENSVHVEVLAEEFTKLLAAKG